MEIRTQLEMSGLKMAAGHASGHDDSEVRQRGPEFWKSPAEDVDAEVLNIQMLFKADETTMRVSINRYKEEESSWV